MLVIIPDGLLDFCALAREFKRGDFGKKPKIWAHRGASGYAPENTLEAFSAAQLGADGVELDVQFTKDRELVVIHDERIDRVSDGSGYVADYTLEELRRFCLWARQFPSLPCKDSHTAEGQDSQAELTVNIGVKTKTCSSGIQHVRTGTGTGKWRER